MKPTIMMTNTAGLIAGIDELVIEPADLAQRGCQVEEALEQPPPLSAARAEAAHAVAVGEIGG